MVQQKLFLYSLGINASQAAELTGLVNKKPEHITFALIENGADIVHNAEEWVGGFRTMLSSNGYQLEIIDLRHWRGRQHSLRKKLKDKDVIWLGGGHTYYLRWILRATGADKMICDLVKAGKVYAGWSAGAVMAGPTTLYFDAIDNPMEAPELIFDGLNLTDFVVIPHRDNKHLSESAWETEYLLRRAGFPTVMLGDSQAMVVRGNYGKVI